MCIGLIPINGWLMEQSTIMTLHVVVPTPLHSKNTLIILDMAYNNIYIIWGIWGLKSRVN